jgi:hypothetical protein
MSAHGRATAVRWNSLDNLSNRKSTRPNSAARGTDRGPEGDLAVPKSAIEYARVVNAVSRWVLKASLSTALACVFGTRFFSGESGTVDHPVPLSILLEHGDALKCVIGWVCAVTVAPLVISAMILNNADRLPYGVDGRGMGSAQEVAEDQKKMDMLTITPPARLNGVEDVIGGETRGTPGSVLFTPGSRGGGGLGSSIPDDTSDGNAVPRTPIISNKSPLVGTPGSRRAQLRSLTPNSQKTPIQDILQDFDAAADAAVNENRATAAAQWHSGLIACLGRSLATRISSCTTLIGSLIHSAWSPSNLPESVSSSSRIPGSATSDCRRTPYRPPFLGLALRCNTGPSSACVVHNEDVLNHHGRHLCDHNPPQRVRNGAANPLNLKLHRHILVSSNFDLERLGKVPCKPLLANRSMLAGPIDPIHGSYTPYTHRPYIRQTNKQGVTYID